MRSSLSDGDSAGEGKVAAPSAAAAAAVAVVGVVPAKE